MKRATQLKIALVMLMYFVGRVAVSVIFNI